MTEWLDLMLDEVRRKNSEAAEAVAEAERRDADQGRTATEATPAKPVTPFKGKTSPGSGT